MSDGDPFRTETLAQIYFSQGRFREAADIYRHLIRTTPDPRRLVPVFLKAEKRALEKKREEVMRKTAHWIRLLMRLNDRKQLSGIRQRYGAERQ